MAVRNRMLGRRHFKCLQPNRKPKACDPLLPLSREVSLRETAL